MAAAGSDGMVHVWSKRQRSHFTTLEFTQAWVRSMSFSCNDQYLISGGEAKNILIWDFNNKANSQLVKADNDVRSITAHPKSCYFAVGGQSSEVSLYDIEGNLVNVLNYAQSQSIRQVKFLQNNDLITLDNHAKVYSWQWGTPRTNPRVLSTADAKIRALAYSEDGKRIAAAGAFALWTWNLPAIAEPTIINLPCFAYAVAFFAADKVAAGCSDGNIWLVDITHERLLQKLSGHRGSVEALAYDAQDKVLYSASFDQTIRGWRNGFFE